VVRSVDVATCAADLGRLAVPAAGWFLQVYWDDSSYNARAFARLRNPENQSVEIELTAALNPVFFGEYAALAREVSRVFREQGVKIRIVNKTVAELFDAMLSGTVDMAVGRWGADYPDADTFAYILHSQEGQLGRLCGTAEIDRLIERGRAETSAAARHSIYREIEELIARDALLLPLFHEQTYRFARPEVRLSLCTG
jgi:peptide/nickel transport system substrate-binding protein